MDIPRFLAQFLRYSFVLPILLLGNTGTGVVVAAMDSGVDTDHADLSDNLRAEACFADNDGAIDGLGRCPNGSDRQTGQLTITHPKD